MIINEGQFLTAQGIIAEEDDLEHFGIKRKSGRFPWGSGKDELTRSQDFSGMIADLRSQGLKDTEIARGFGMTTSEFRNTVTIARNIQTQADIAMAQRLKDRGWSQTAIAKRMDKPESTVRSLLKQGEKHKEDVLEATSKVLRDAVAEKGIVDIGTQVERHMNISKEKLKTAVALLKEEGYGVHYVKVEQLGTGKETTLKVLAPPGMTSRDVYHNRDEIQQITDYSTDGGETYTRIMPPVSIDSKRVKVRYAEEGGTDADGVIYVRPGKDDLSLGTSRYAQVRIAVDNTHYLKGMAIYRDDLPPGVDLVFNTNKSNTGNKLDAMKEMSPEADDPVNRFGSQIKRQITKMGAGGKKEVTSVMNIVNEEGDWDKWSKSLSSQMLSKQSPALIKSQLDVTQERKTREFDEITKLTNPAVKEKLLESFADDADSSAVHLKAAALPRQATKVILPVNSMKETEVYAPTFRDGERVVLVRFPHGGTFEIPELTVNNRHPDAKKLIGPDAPDAIGIHSKVAERLSGADFDGDQVLIIPQDGRIKTTAPLEGLKDFDPKAAYPKYDSMPEMSARTLGTQMGLVSNLITDMTLHGANEDELTRAVKHSMVVIDAKKHKLNYRQSAIDNGIPALMEKYQKSRQGGASTLISQSGKATTVINERKARPMSEGGPIDRETGKKVYVETGNTYTKKVTNKRTGEVTEKVVVKKEKVSRLGDVDDARKLSSGTLQESLYADYSNSMKSLANRARREMLATRPTPYSPSAKKTYASQVKSLDAKLAVALKNAPLERQAQVIANATFKQKKAANPDLDAAEIKKLKSQELARARARTGAGKDRIEITTDEWQAIQAGAITHSKLKQILANADMDRVKELATPRTVATMSPAMKTRAQALVNTGRYTQAEIADALGVSVSTLKSSLSEG